MTKHKIQNKFKCQITNDKTLVLVFVILILSLFCALNFDICHLQINFGYALFAAEEAAESDQQISDFSLAGYADEGKKAWEISGKSADIFTDVIKLKDVLGNMYDKKETVKLTADRGDFNKVQGKVHLEENVVITTSSGARLTTDTLDWDRKQQLVSTKDLVNITKENMFTKAVGATGHPNLSQVNLLKEVQVEIYPAKEQKQEKTVITCDGPLEIDYAKNVAVFKHNVKVDNIDMVMYSDIMDVYFTRQEEGVGQANEAGALMGSKIEKIIARGNVKIVKGENLSYSDEATYVGADKKIILTGTPRVVIYSTEGLKNTLGVN